MVTGSGIVEIRPYIERDAAATLATFLAAVTITASADYSVEQIAAWSAPHERDEVDWNRVRMSLGTIVATVGEDVAGFSDVTATGYIDMLFVLPRFGRRGVASTLLSEIERKAVDSGTSTLSTNASITARRFFERHDFQVESEQHPVIRGIRMTNYRMIKLLA
ncbi:MAG: GNAT family N-acetyltransferase [Lacisediminihabitans sp.]